MCGSSWFANAIAAYCLDARQAGLARVEAALGEIKAMLAASLPHLATRAELADLRGALRTELGEKPGKLYMWGILAVLVAAYAARARGAGGAEIGGSRRR